MFVCGGVGCGEGGGGAATLAGVFGRFVGVSSAFGILGEMLIS